MENKTMTAEPTTLQEAIVYFSNPDNCLDYLVARRWADGVICPTCGSKDVRFTTRRMWECRNIHPRRQFSIKIGTVLEDSPIGLDKWLMAMWMIANCKNGISSYEIARDLHITQKSAWFMLHRIRRAMQEQSIGKLSGEVEVDETFIGGKARNMHIAQRKRRITGTGGKGKAVAVGFVERGGKVQTVVVENRKKKTLQDEVKRRIEAGAALYTDELLSYEGLEGQYAHQVINHAVAYVEGRVHTNTMENFWSLLKRSLHGTYVSVEPFHLFRYLDEQSFRYNTCKDLDDSGRFEQAMNAVAGKRLTYKEVSGKLHDPEKSHCDADAEQH